MHVIMLPLFPLMAVGPWLLTSRVNKPLGWAVALLGYTFACGYTGLDVLAGIGAGTLQEHYGGGGANFLFDKGGQLADVAVYAYLAAAAITGIACITRAGLWAVPGSALVVGGALSFRDSHVYWPRGVFTLLTLAVGWALLLWALDAASHPTVAPADAVESTDAGNANEH